ncbi:hypothetical protein EniLVp02_0187 [Vibrio phage EniLVp02]
MTPEQDIIAEQDEREFIESHTADQEMVAKLLESSRAARQKAAEKYLRKNKREILRLEKLAKDALIDDNEESYIYAIGKLRSFTGGNVDVDVLRTLWKTSREQVVNLTATAFESQYHARGIDTFYWTGSSRLDAFNERFAPILDKPATVSEKRPGALDVSYKGRSWLIPQNFAIIFGSDTIETHYI